MFFVPEPKTVTLETIVFSSLSRKSLHDDENFYIPSQLKSCIEHTVSERDFKKIGVLFEKSLTLQDIVTKEQLIDQFYLCAIRKKFSYADFANLREIIPINLDRYINHTVSGFCKPPKNKSTPLLFLIVDYGAPTDLLKYFVANQANLQILSHKGKSLLGKIEKIIEEITTEIEKPEPRYLLAFNLERKKQLEEMLDIIYQELGSRLYQDSQKNLIPSIKNAIHSRNFFKIEEIYKGAFLSEEPIDALIDQIYFCAVKGKFNPEEFERLTTIIPINFNRIINFQGAPEECCNSPDRKVSLLQLIIYYGRKDLMMYMANKIFSSPTLETKKTLEIIANMLSKALSDDSLKKVDDEEKNDNQKMETDDPKSSSDEEMIQDQPETDADAESANIFQNTNIL